MFKLKYYFPLFHVIISDFLQTVCRSMFSVQCLYSIFQKDL